MPDDQQPRDTGDIAEVPESEWLKTDRGDGADATDGGLDDDLADVYDDPGEVVEEDLG